MTLRARSLVFCVALIAGMAGCRDVGVVGESRPCAGGCPSGEACVSGECKPIADGGDDDNGDDGHEDEEHEDEEHEEEEGLPEDEP